MSHITTTKNRIKGGIKNESGIKKAIALMAKEFPGLTYEQKNPDLIQIRYAPIEVYQKKGNMRLVKNGSVWDLQEDTWNCDDMVHKVHESFERNYEKAGAIAFCETFGYMTDEKPIEGGSRLIAVKF